MAKKPIFLKNLLTTASAVAVIAGSSGAMGGAAVQVTGNAVLSTGNNTTAGGAIVAGSTLQYDATAGHTLAVDPAAAGFVIAAIDVHLSAPGAATQTANNTVLGPVIAGGTANRLAWNVNAAKTLTLNGAPVNVALAGNGGFVATVNDYTGLGAITLSNAAADLIINPNGGVGNTITLTGAIDGSAAGTGLITTGAGNVVFNGKIGNTNGVQQITVNANSDVTFGANVKLDDAVGASGITFAGVGSVTVNDGINITGTANVGGNGTDITGANGTLTFRGASTVTGTTIGNANALAAINIGNNNGGGVVTFTSAANAATITATAITLANVKSNLTINAAVANTAVTGNILGDGNAAGRGILTIGGANDTTITGNIGMNAANAAYLSNINFTADKSLILHTAAANSNGTLGVNTITTTANNQGTLSLGLNAAQTIVGNIGANGNALKTLQLHSSDGAGGALTTVTVNPNVSIYAQTVNLAGAAKMNVLKLSAGSSINGAVDTANANDGQIVVLTNTGGANATTISGNIGATNAIDSISFDTGAANGSTLNLGAAAITTNNTALAFGTVDGIVNLTKAGNITITSANAVTVNGTVGTITANNIPNTVGLTIAGQIGDPAVAANALKLLKVSSHVALSKDANIAEIDTSASTAVPAQIELDGANYLIGKVMPSANTVVTIGANLLLKTGTNISNVPLQFGGANTVTLEDGVNLGAVTTTAINNGTLTFGAGAGGSVAGPVGFGSAIAAINVNGGAGKTVEFKDTVNTNGAVTLAANSTVQFDKSVTAADVAGAAANNGTIIFNNTDTITVTGKIGNAAAVQAVQINGTGDIDMSKLTKFASNTGIAFGKDSKGVVTFNINLANTNITTAAASGTNNINVAIDQVLGGAIGTAANTLGNINFNADTKITVNTANFHAGITTSADNTGVVTISAAATGITGLGSSVAALKSVTFTESATVTKDAYAVTTIVNDAKTATFGGGLFGSTAGATLTLGSGAGDGTATFTGDNAILGVTVTNHTNTTGVLTFQSGAIINKDIGTAANTLKTVSFGPAAAAATAPTVELNSGNIFADNISFSNATVTLGNNVTLTGATALNDTTVNLAGSNVTLAGNTTATKALTVNTDYTDTARGSIIVATGKTLDVGAATGVTILINDTAKLPGSTPETFSLISLADTTTSKFVPNATTTITADGSKAKFVTWAIDATTYKLTRTNNAQAGIDKVMTDAPSNISKFVDKDALNSIVDSNNTGSAQQFIDEVAQMSATDAALAIAKLTSVPVGAGEVSSSTASGTTNAISTRLASASGIATTVQAMTQNDMGVAAGDELTAENYGVWGMPFYNKSTQKARKGVSGYKDTTTGGIIGFDTKANDRLTIGAAVTTAQSTLKHQDVKVGDKTKSNTWMFSIYGSQQVTDNWFVQGIASFGTTAVKNQAKRLTAAGSETASGKYDSMTYNGEVLAGYNYRLADTATVTPTFGLAYSRFNDTGYQETGTTSQNLTVSKKSTNKFEGIFGARVACTTDMSGIVLTPEVHAFARYDLSAKVQRTNITLDGLVKPIVAKSAKPARGSYNVGFGVTTKSGMMEYGAGYDLQLSNKYVGQQGTLKVRVNF